VFLPAASSRLPLPSRLKLSTGGILTRDTK
jgi:hypothetical protein